MEVSVKAKLTSCFMHWLTYWPEFLFSFFFHGDLSLEVTLMEYNRTHTESTQPFYNMYIEHLLCPKAMKLKRRLQSSGF